LLGAQYEVFGLMPWGYHLASLALHCANGAALMILAAASVGLISLAWRLSATWRDTDALIDRAATAGTLSLPTYLMALGKRHERVHELEEAESCFRQALQLAPSRADVADVLGGYLYRREKLAEALAMVEHSIQIDPRFAPGYNHLGLMLAEKGRVNEAAQRFESALYLHPYYNEYFPETGAFTFPRINSPNDPTGVNWTKVWGVCGTGVGIPTD
jgi:tetratricopeptide (TPR) repeat protein